MADPDDTFMIGKSRPIRSDAVKNRRILLEAASDLFLKKGVEAVSMTLIAQAAGVGKGTLYRHFHNKAELCHALLDQDMYDLQEDTLQQLNEQQSNLKTLKWFLINVLRFVDRNHELLFEASETGNIPTLAFSAHIWWRQTIRGLLVRLSPHENVDYLSDVLYIMLDVNTVNFQCRTLGYDLNQVEDSLLDVVDRLLNLPHAPK